MTRHLLLRLWPLCLLFLLCCKQGLNERCQTQGDCGDGLVCELVNSMNPSQGGQCINPNQVSSDMATTVDLTTQPDQSVTDQGAGDLGDLSTGN